MTVSTSQFSQTFLGNNSAVSWTFNFIGVSASDIVVSHYIGSTKTLVILDPSQYILFLNPALPGATWGVGGTITYPTSGSPMPNGDFITITRLVPYTQEVSIEDQGDFYPEVTETALDTLEFQIQQIVGRTLSWRGVWNTAVNYSIGDLVIDGANGLNSGNLYLCINANLSGVWSTDLTNGDWFLIMQSGTLSTPLPLSIALGGTGATTVAGALSNLGLGSAALENLGTVIIDDGAGHLTIGNNEVSNAMLAQGPGLSVKGVAGASTANEGDITLAATNLLGVNSGGTTLGPVSLGSGLSMSGSTLSATASGGGGGVSVSGVLNCSYSVADTTALLTPSLQAWSTAPLNTTGQNSVTGASRSGSVVTLPVGKYLFWADFSTSTNNSTPLELRVRNTTAGTTMSGSVRGSGGVNGGVSAWPTALFGYYEVVGSPITVELQYYLNKVSGPTIGVNSTQNSLGGAETINWATLQFVQVNSNSALSPYTTLLTGSIDTSVNGGLLDLSSIPNDTYVKLIVEITTLVSTGASGTSTIYLEFAQGGVANSASDYGQLAGIGIGVGGANFNQAPTSAAKIISTSTDNLSDGRGTLTLYGFCSTTTKKWQDVDVTLLGFTDNVTLSSRVGYTGFNKIWGNGGSDTNVTNGLAFKVSNFTKATFNYTVYGVTG